MQIIELLTPSYDVAWLPWAVQYFFLIGIASTTALMASACALFVDPKHDAFKLLPVLVVILVASAITAPVSLLADLQQPARFWHFYAYPSQWSWMSAGAFFLPVFVGLSLLFGFVWWAGKLRLLKIVSAALIVSAISVLVYTGMEVMVIRSRPLWNTPFLPVNLALTAWLASLGAIFLIGRWVPGGLNNMPVHLVRKLSLLAAAALVVCALIWLVLGVTGSEPSFNAAISIFERFPVWRVGLSGSVVVGILVIALLSVSHASLSRSVPSLVVGVIMLASAWMFRWIIFMAVQGVPKYGAGLYLYSMPLGSDGMAGMLGVLGLCIAVLCVITLVLERFPSKLGTNYSLIN